MVKLILPKVYSFKIIVSSIFTLSPPLFYGIFKKQYIFASILGCILLSSINYWKHPILGLRRNIDMTFVKINVLYQHYTIYYYNLNFLHYYLLSGLGLLCYIISKKRNDFEYKCNFHILFHVFVCIANLNIIFNIPF